MPSAVLVRVVRAGVEESVHRGHAVAVRGDAVVWSAGDPGAVVFYRSAVKPFQALAAVESGAVDAFGLTPFAVALMAGSHAGTHVHVEGVREILRRAGLTEADLRCGAHPPLDPAAARALAVAGRAPTAVHHNCSGKHAGMLAAAKRLGVDPASYLDPEGPVQRLILDRLATLLGTPRTRVVVGVDGCSAPAPAAPLAALARAWSHLVAPGDGLPAPLAAGLRRVADAMAAHPDGVAGGGRFDTALMEASGGRVLAKAGAEGVHAAAVRDRGIGLAVKVEDGGDRGYRALVVATLRALGGLDDAGVARLEGHAPRLLRNAAGREVGRIELVAPLPA